MKDAMKSNQPLNLSPRMMLFSKQLMKIVNMNQMIHLEVSTYPKVMCNEKL